VRVVVIGGGGHVGSYLAPRLVEEGHRVTAITRGLAEPYVGGSLWDEVERVQLDRDEAERTSELGEALLRLAPDVVVDLVCFRVDSAEYLVDALRGSVSQVVHCGTIFVNGHGVEVPTTEAQPRNPFGEYGTRKAEIESLLLAEARERGFPVTVLHPGHVVGEGWWPVNPQGHVNPSVFATLARGETLTLPHFGLETLHHVHSADVAQAFVRAIERPDAANGESFYVVSDEAVTLRGFAEAVAGWYGQPARLELLPWDQWSRTVYEVDSAVTWEHIARSPSHSCAKARTLLGYAPSYSSLSAVRESIRSLGMADG
jgi:nucleoside-diphosphate-sugar epimerase